MSVQARGARHQLRLKHKLLPKPFFFTFDDETEARNYGQQLHALLDKGIVPEELLAARPKGDDPLVIEVVRGYMKAAPVTDSDDALLGVMLAELTGLRVSGVTYLWAEGYVRRLKTEKHLSPGTIRKRVGVLGRVFDWHLRRASTAGQHAPANPFRLLPRGYSLYTADDAQELARRDLQVKHDITRDRRLAPDEEARILAALAGEKRAGRERALVVDESFTTLYHLIVDTGMRLREAYRLRVDQVDLERRIVHVDGSKGHRGVIKPRTVPLKAQLLERLRAYCKGRVGLLFPFWDGVPSQLSLRRATAKLSTRFGVLFDFAQVADISEHDLRHEATCRWVELRRPGGGWVFSDIEVCRIMGWTDPKMMLRYASLRGEDLADRLSEAQGAPAAPAAGHDRRQA